MMRRFRLRRALKISKRKHETFHRSFPGTVRRLTLRCVLQLYMERKKEGESILIKNASRMDVDGTTIRIRDIMGAEIEVEGAIAMVDLANSVVKINCIED